MSQTNPPPLSRPMQLVAVLVFLLGVVVAALHVIGAIQHPDGTGLRAFMAGFGPAFLYIVASWVLAALFWKTDQSSAAAGVQSLLPALHQMNYTLTEIQSRLEALEPGAGPTTPREMPTPIDMREPAEPIDTPPPPMHALLQSIEELRRLVMLSDEQRQHLAKEQAAQQRRANLAAARDAIDNAQWGQAQHYLDALTSTSADDPEVLSLRQAIEQGRAKVQTDAIRKAAASIEDLMAMTQWDMALGEASELAANFPGNPDAQAILARVQRERDLYRESMTRQLFDETRRQVERRQWRKALAAARRLAEQFPDHKLGQRMAEQVPTLAANAEVEDRQEREQKIQDMIQRKRFADAIELGQELLRLYPNSPQAAMLRELLPQLAERAQAAR